MNFIWISSRVTSPRFFLRRPRRRPWPLRAATACRSRFGTRPSCCAGSRARGARRRRARRPRRNRRSRVHERRVWDAPPRRRRSRRRAAAGGVRRRDAQEAPLAGPGRKGGDFCRAGRGADASGARGALGNSPAARAFATRGAVAPILPAKETVRAAILTLRVCVLKWMTAGGQKSSWRPLCSFRGWLRENRGGAGARWERSILALDSGRPANQSCKSPKKRGSGPKLADRPHQSSPRLPGKISPLRVKSQRQLGKALCNRRYCNFKIRTHCPITTLFLTVHLFACASSKYILGHPVDSTGHARVHPGRRWRPSGSTSTPPRTR